MQCACVCCTVLDKKYFGDKLLFGVYWLETKALFQGPLNSVCTIYEELDLTKRYYSAVLIEIKNTTRQAFVTTGALFDEIYVRERHFWAVIG